MSYKEKEMSFIARFLNTIGILSDHDIQVVSHLYNGIRQYSTNALPIVPYQTPPQQQIIKVEPIQGSLLYPYRNLDDSLQAMEEGRFACNGDVLNMNALSSAELNAHNAFWIGKEAGYNMEISFKDAQYNIVELEDDVYLYRAGQRNRTMGQFFARNPPKKRFEVRFNSAVLTEWSYLDTVYKVRIPRYTILYDGYIAPQGNVHVGLGKQIFIPQPWKIPGLEESAMVIQRWEGDGRGMGTLEAITS